jgi:putative ABC transport system permease protein
MTWLNVRERRAEIGVLRALGKGLGALLRCCWAKRFLMGLLGGAAGCLVGYLLTPVVGSRTMQITPICFKLTQLLVGTLIGAPLVTMMASYLPSPLSAIAQDPACSGRS